MSSSETPIEASQTWDAFCTRLFDQNRFAIKLGLDNMKAALDAAHHPERAHRRIIVGGTNGKGTTAAVCAAILQAHGLRVGLYTSPHLVELRERFRIDGVPVSRETTLRHGQELLARYGVPEGARSTLTFFELTTLMACHIFAEAEVDVAIYEVGLGGRLDAVNAIEPDLTLITRIARDHEEYLGESISQIAAEKAALVRPEVPAYFIEQDDAEAAAVLRGTNAVQVEAEAPVDSSPAADAARPASWLLAPAMALAYAGARRVLGASWNEETAAHGVARARWPGRTDVRSVDGHEFVVDGAHNPDGARRFWSWVEARGGVDAVVFGAMADKRHDEMLAPLRHSSVAVFAAEVASSRSAPFEALRASLGRELAGAGPSARMFEASRDLGSRTAVFGSLYLVGEFFDWAGVGSDGLVTWL